MHTSSIGKINFSIRISFEITKKTKTIDFDEIALLRDFSHK